MRVTASIVTYHTDLEELRKSLDCLLHDDVGRVFVIDNSSLPAIAHACGYDDRITYISSANVGYGAAHNVAMRRAIECGAKYHLVMNSDIVFGRGTISSLVAFMDAEPGAGAVQPRIVGTDGKLQFTVRMLPSPFILFARRFIPAFSRSGVCRRYELRHIDHDLTFNPPYHQGSFMFMRVDSLRDVGLFDERFFMYPEDIDLTRRIHARYTTPYLPSVTVIHAHRRASYRSLRMLMIHCRNIIRYFNKWGWLHDSQRVRFNAPFR